MTSGALTGGRTERTGGLDRTAKKKNHNKINGATAERVTRTKNAFRTARISRTAGENRCPNGICINEAKPKVNVARNDLPRIVGTPCGVVCPRGLLLFIGIPARRAMEINSTLHDAYSLFLCFSSFVSCRADLVERAPLLVHNHFRKKDVEDANQLLIGNVSKLFSFLENFMNLLNKI